MATGFPMMGGQSIVGLPTSKTRPMFGGSISHMRAPTDPYYTAPVYIKNMEENSNYALGWDNAGTFEILSSGTNGTNRDFTIAGVPSYAAPMLLQLRVRKASASPKYKPLRTYAYHSSAGATIYVSQIPSEIT